jgi:hypothetical protein
MPIRTSLLMIAGHQALTEYGEKYYAASVRWLRCRVMRLAVMNATWGLAKATLTGS